MHIVLLRRETRALILPHGKDLMDCPVLVRQWLGVPYTKSYAELTADMPLPDLPPPLVLAEILQKGFCALDMDGVVRVFEASAPETLEEALARGADLSATDLLRGEEQNPGTTRR